MKMSDWYYILKIDYNFDEIGLEINRLILSKNLLIEWKVDEWWWIMMMYWLK